MARKAVALLERIMVRAPHRLFHQIPVADDADSGARRPEKPFLLRAMRVMTRIATAFENGIVNIRLQEFPLRVGMAGVTYPVLPVVQYRLIVGSVGVVTGGACRILERLMDGFRRQSRLHVRMASKTEFSLLPDEEPFLDGGVGRMAGETSSLSRQSGMRFTELPALLFVTDQADAVSITNEKGRVLRGVGVMAGETLTGLERLMLVSSPLLQARRIMALVAEITLLFRRLKGFRRRGRFVAVSATRFRDGIVGAGFQQFSLRRGMGIVAGRA